MSSLTSANRIRIREGWHAYNHTVALRAKDPKLEEVLYKGKQAVDTLFSAVSLVLAEKADDTPCRLARNRAASELRVCTIASLRRLEATVSLRATDTVTGLVNDQPAIDRVKSKISEYLPHGQPSGLANDGPALSLQAGLVRDMVASEPECKEMAENLGKLVTTHREAMEAVSREAEELVDVRKTLETARSEVDRLRRAGWLYVQFLQSWAEMEIDLGAIYPVNERSRDHAPTEADAALDAAGAPQAPVLPVPLEVAPAEAASVAPIVPETIS